MGGLQESEGFVVGWYGWNGGGGEFGWGWYFWGSVRSGQ